MRKGLRVLKPYARRIAGYAARVVGIGATIAIAACPRMITDSGLVLTVAPGTAKLFVADSLRFSATLVDKSGATVSAPMSWTVDNTAVATVDRTGLVHAIASGSANVRATARGEVGTAAIVVAVDSGQTLSVAPTSLSLSVNGTQQLTAVLKDRHGKQIAANPTWVSSNTAVATVDGNGVVKAVAAGSTTIQAKVGALVASAAVTVSTASAGAVLVGAGDIATCTNQNDSLTARIVEGISGATVFVAGDNAYPNGSPDDYANCYGPTWGRFKSRTRPAPGNHEYQCTPTASPPIPGCTSPAAGYFGYFGAAAGDPTKGYYSYDLGAWHIVAINSTMTRTAGSAMEQWLRADLAAHPAKCTLAYWHYPRFSSGSTHGSDVSMQPIWQALYDYGADVVVSGHEHNYERFAPQTPTGELDNVNGIREFVVGTGGAGNYTFGAPQPNSEVRYNATPGVIKFTLYADHYEWQFIPISGSFSDSGSGSCH